jgi:hypothetical protein
LKNATALSKAQKHRTADHEADVIAISYAGERALQREPRERVDWRVYTFSRAAAKANARRRQVLAPPASELAKRLVARR